MPEGQEEKLVHIYKILSTLAAVVRLCEGTWTRFRFFFSIEKSTHVPSGIRKSIDWRRVRPNDDGNLVWLEKPRPPPTPRNGNKTLAAAN